MWVIQRVASTVRKGMFPAIFSFFWAASAAAQVSIELDIKEPCPGLSNAEVTATARGGIAPYSYRWSTGASGAVLSNVRSGNYGLTVTDVLGVRATALANVVEPLPFRLEFDEEGCESSFTLTAIGAGGTQPYGYYWNTGARAATISGLSAGTYCVTLTDTNRCGIQSCYTVVAAAPLSLTMSSSSASCAGISDGSARVIVTGGTAPYSYRWPNGTLTAVASGLSGGTYRVTVTDSKGCTKTGSVTVNQPTALEVGVTGTSNVCAGATGTLTASVSGGNAPFSYRWSNGQTGVSITGVPAGTYRVTATDARGCTASSAPYVISGSTLSGVDIQGDAVVCGTGETTSLRAIPIGGTAPYIFRWSNGATEQVVSGLGAGTYRVTVTDAGGCSVNNNITVTAVNLTLSFSQSDPSCFGEGNGSIAVRVDGGAAPYLYNWAHTSLDTAVLNNLSAGTYFLTVVDNQGCIANGQIAIDQPEAISISISRPEDFICYGESTGWLQANVTGGKGPYRYQWGTPEGQQTALADQLPAGIYGLTVIDGNDCVATASGTITQYSPLDVYVATESVICGSAAEGITGEATLVVRGGKGPYQYAWSNGATAEYESGLGSGSYTVTVSDAAGCTAETTFRITVTDPIELNVNVTENLCQGESSGSINLDIRKGTPPYTIRWSTGETSPVITDLSSGIYTVTVSDATGCFAEQTVVVSAPEALVIDLLTLDVSCYGGSDGAARIVGTGGTGPYSYYWSTGDTTDTVEDLAPGIYTLEVTDFNDCSAVTETFVINEPAALSIDVLANPVACAGESSGELRVVVNGGTPGYNILWSTGDTGPILSNVPSGFYSLTVTDANNCTLEVLSIEQAEADSLSITFDVTNIDCDNNPIGAVNALLAGGTLPYSYSWSTGDTTASISGLFPGIYALTVVDSVGCTAMDSVQVLGTPELIIGASPTNVSCFGGMDGQIDLNFTSGNPPFSVIWNTGATDTLITGLGVGTYSVTVTNTDGCSAIIPAINITQPAQLAIGLVSALNPSCFGATDGAISVNITGGTSPFTYLWSSGQTTSAITGLGAGTYQLTVTDRNDCTVNTTFTLSDPDELLLVAGELTATCTGENTGSARASASGGVPPYSFLWSNGASGDQADTLAAGTYTVTVTDFNDCTATAMVTINTFDQPVCEIIVLQPVIMGADGELEVQVTGGTAPFDYLWNTGDTTAQLSGLAGGTYSVTVTDDNGCSTACSVELMAMSGVGDYVWEDENKNGLQDAGEPGVAGVVVVLKDAFGVSLATDTTDAFGEYMFVGLNAGTYALAFILPDSSWTFTLPDAGANDLSDSDALSDMNGMTALFNLVPGEIRESLDAGMYVKPVKTNMVYCVCLDNATNEDNGQFANGLLIESYPNELWRVASGTGGYDDVTSPNPPAAPVPLDPGFPLQEIQQGVYSLDFRSVDADSFNYILTNGIDEIAIEGYCTYPSINLDMIDTTNICASDPPIGLNATPDIPGTIAYFIDNSPVTEINPGALGSGNYELLVVFDPQDSEECTAQILLPLTIRDSCFSFISGFVWLDANRDGLQHPMETGLEGVKVTVERTGGGSAYTDTTTTDAAGNYMFTVLPGTYKLTFMFSQKYLLTVADQGTNDDLDSDVEVMTGMTADFVVGKDATVNQDAGLVLACDNITDAGEIGYDQYLCGPGNIPEPLVSLESPSGGFGAIEYLWMKSTNPGPFNAQTWDMIENSNTPEYAPGVLYETTYFARCARRDGCGAFLETRIVTVEVGTEALATIAGPAPVCAGTTVTFSAPDAGSRAKISWDFGFTASPRYSDKANATVTFPFVGIFPIRLTVEENGCVSTRVQNLTVVNTPTTCGTGLVIDLSTNPEAHAILRWEILDLYEHTFVVERSADSLEFYELAEVVAPRAKIGYAMYYEFVDKKPKRGHNFYRVKLVDREGAFAYSNIETLLLPGANDSELVMAYPNPVTEQLTVEILEDFDTPVSIELINISGNNLYQQRLRPNTIQTKIDLSAYPPGVYLLKVSYGSVDVKVIKILKR
ncbi:MAG: T9SS type A sorting domain-containing protein [Saprospiraceae bacterium]|nr:T9SS type A sorting domain-containing protein [Saprospiraceae bacterium]